MTQKVLTITHSEAKQWKECSYAYDIKYRRKLAPRQHRRPLTLGSWVHTCLENYYTELGWKGALEDLIRLEWNELFEEERELLGDLPKDTKTIMEGYEYRYRDEGWELMLPPEVKFEVVVETANTAIKYIGRVDLVVRDKMGSVWCIDHKTSKRIPEDGTFRAMDPQLSLYPWALEKQYGIKCDGTMYNFLRTKLPTVPKELKRGGLSKRKIRTTPIVFVRFLRSQGLDPKDYISELRQIQADQSYFFWRLMVPRNPKATEHIIQDLATTALYIDRLKVPVRNITPRCEWCPYLDLCFAELHGMDTSEILQHFITREPYEYLHLDEEELELGLLE